MSLGKDGLRFILRSGEWLTEANSFFLSTTFLNTTDSERESSSTSPFSCTGWVSSSLSVFRSRWLRGGKMDLLSGRSVYYLALSSPVALRLYLCLTQFAFSKSSTRAHYLRARSVAFYIASRLSLNSWSFCCSGLKFWVIFKRPTLLVSLSFPSPPSSCTALSEGECDSLSFF